MSFDTPFKVFYVCPYECIVYEPTGFKPNKFEVTQCFGVPRISDGNCSKEISVFVSIDGTMHTWEIEGLLDAANLYSIKMLLAWILQF